MGRQEVKSREYKVMLRPERSAGDEATARKAIDVFWAEVQQHLKALDIPAEGTFDELKAHRRVRFFDTAAHWLNSNRYVFRERIDVETGDER